MRAGAGAMDRPGRQVRSGAWAAIALVVALIVAAPMPASVSAQAAPVAAAAARGGRGDPRSRTRLAARVVIVLVGGVSWDDLNRVEAAGLADTMRSGWMANINVATGGLVRTQDDAAVSLGSASPAVGGWAAGSAYDSAEPVEGFSAEDAYVRQTGQLPLGSAVLDTGIGALEKMNSGSALPIRPGLMGSIVSALGRKTAVLGSSDTSLARASSPAHREAASVAMDEYGRVDLGDVGPSVLVPDREMAYGVRSNTADLLYRYSQLPDDVGLVVIGLGDTVRASRARDSATPAAEQILRGKALARTSEFVARLKALLGGSAALMIISPVADDAAADPPALTPFSLIIPGAAPGYAVSSSTKRTGLVTGSDVVRTVAYVLTGRDALASDVGGGAIVRAGSATPPAVSILASDSRMAVVSDTARPSILSGWAFLQALATIIVVMLLRAETPDEGLSRLTEALLMFLVALPLAGYVAGWVWAAVSAGHPGTPLATVPAYDIVTVAPAAALAAGLALTRSRPSRQLMWVLAATAVVLLADQFAGSHAAAGTLLGYSLTDGARYYGLGNEAYAVLFAAVALAGGIALDAAPDQWMRRRWFFAAVFVAVVLVVGLPMLGANIGGFASMAVGFGVIWLGWDGKKPSWGLAVVIAALVAASAALLVGLDLLRAPSVATHYAGAARAVSAGGLAGLVDIVRQRGALNLSYFTKSPYPWVLVIVLVVLAIERRRPSGLAAAFLVERPRLATALTGIFAAGIVATLIEDTGITIPAIMLAVTLPAVLLLMLAAARGQRGALEL